MPQPLTVHRVLGDQPFAEIGEPQAVAVDPDRGLIAIGGHQGWLYRRGVEGWRPHVLGLYDRSDLRCRSLLRLRYPVRSVDFHPRQPLLAVGTGSYDGGWSFHGELLLVHLDTGTVVSALADSREVRAVRWRTWRHGRVLDLALAPFSEFEFGNAAMTIGFDAMVTRDDWLAVGDGEIGFDELDGPLRDSDVITPDQARAAVEALSPDWSHRGPIRAVAPLPAGRVLATVDGPRLESWLPAEELEWSVDPVVEVEGTLVCKGPEITRHRPDGEILWHLTVDHPVTAFHVDGSLLYVALNSGALLGVDFDAGAVLWQQELSVHGQPSVGSSLASADSGLLIGTVDGRILDCR